MAKTPFRSVIASFLMIGISCACSSNPKDETNIDQASVFTESFCDQIQTRAEETGYTQQLINEATTLIGSSPDQTVEGNQTKYNWGDDLQGLTIMLTTGGGGVSCHYIP